MATGFSPREQENIRMALREAASRRAAQGGMKKTSVDELCAEAGISKGAFYKFYPSKEHLFLDVVEYWHSLVSKRAEEALQNSHGLNGSQRAALMMKTAWRVMQEQSLDRFNREDLPLILRKLPEAAVQEYNVSNARFVHEVIEKTGVRLNVPEKLAYTMASLLFMTLYNAQYVGEPFEESLDMLIDCACKEIVLP